MRDTLCQFDINMAWQVQVADATDEIVWLGFSQSPSHFRPLTLYLRSIVLLLVIARLFLNSVNQKFFA